MRILPLLSLVVVFQVESHDFAAVNVVFENSAGHNCGGSSGQHQAVAVRVTADRASFYDCSFLGWQDTLYAHNGMHEQTLHTLRFATNKCRY